MIVGSEASVRIRLPRVIMKATASTGIAPDIVYLGYGVPAASYSSVANTDTVFIPKGLGFASPPSCDASIHAPFTPAGVHRLAIVRIREVLPAMIVSLCGFSEALPKCASMSKFREAGSPRLQDKLRTS